MRAPSPPADGLLLRMRQGVRLARSGAPRLLDALLGVQVIEALALAASVHAIQRLAATVFSAAPGTAIAGSDLVAPGCVLLIAVCVAGVCQAAQPSIALVLGERLAGQSAAEVLAVAGTIELSDFDRPEVLDRLKRVEFGAMIRPAQVASGLGILLSGAVGSVALTLAVLAMQPWLAVAAAVAAAPLWWAAQRDGASQYESVRGLSRLERRRMYLAGLLTSRERAAEVRALELTPVLLGRYRELSRQRCAEVTSKALDRLRRQLAARAVSGALLLLGVLILVAMLRADALSLADAVAAGAAGAALRGRLADAAAGIRQLQEAAEYVDDHAAVMRAAGAARDLETTLGDGVVEPLRTLALRGVSMIYPGMETPALRDVDLDLRVGEVVAVVGVNGSGKSTMAALIAGLLTPTSGAVLRNGVDLRQLPAQCWRPDVSVLLQDAGRYQESVRDNVSFGDVRRPVDDHAVVASLIAAGAQSFLTLTDEGLDAQLGREQDGGFELSGGQWQRVALARTFYRGGQLLILDEPSAALDPLAERDLVDRMRRSFTDRAVLLITHRMSAARTADRIVVLEQGSIIEQGTPLELLQADGPFALMCLAQSQLWEEQPKILAATP